MGLLHVDVPLLLLTDTGRLRAALRMVRRDMESPGQTQCFQNLRRGVLLFCTSKQSHLAEDGLHSVGVEPKLTLPAQLLVVHLVRVGRTHCESGLGQSIHVAH